jgi:DNA-binding response OmpR family regulator
VTQREEFVAREAPDEAALESAKGSPAGGVTILLVDDSATTLLQIGRFLVGQGHRVVTAGDGDIALRCFREMRPDLVLMDVMMPNVDGIQATRQLRAEFSALWIPIILMSSLDAEEDIVNGLEAGADDYLTKPVHLSVLRAKICSFQRIVSMQQELLAQAATLRKLQDEQAYEHELAASLIQNLVQRAGLNEEVLSWRVRPSARFSGDVVAAARDPGGLLYAVLGDATGHGLAASVSLIPALQVFYGMVRKGFPLGALVREMNHRLREQLPIGRYFAAMVIVVNEKARQIEFWNGGMPPALLLTAGEGIRIELVSTHVALGILPDELFDESTDVAAWTAGEGLVMYSDGVIEAADSEGNVYGSDRLRLLVSEARGVPLVDHIMNDLDAFMGNAATQDDASILAISLT